MNRQEREQVSRVANQLEDISNIECTHGLFDAGEQLDKVLSIVRDASYILRDIRSCDEHIDGVQSAQMRIDDFLENNA